MIVVKMLQGSSKSPSCEMIESFGPSTRVDSRAFTMLHRLQRLSSRHPNLHGSNGFMSRVHSPLKPEILQVR
jgi:hypothetical protein